MRIYLILSSNKETVPYTYQQQLVGTLHKWMGKNVFHDDISLYSLSWLDGGKGYKNGLDFKNGACWFISSPNIDIIKKLIKNIQNDPAIAFGMTVKELILKDTPNFPEKIRFNVATPVFIKRTIGEREVHYTFRDENVNQLLTETLKSKLKKAGLTTENIKVSFDVNYPNAKTKLITYRGIKNKANFCPVILEGSPELIAFAWDVGIGNSTGIGFGALQ